MAIAAFIQAQESSPASMSASSPAWDVSKTLVIREVVQAKPVEIGDIIPAASIDVVMKMPVIKNGNTDAETKANIKAVDAYANKLISSISKSFTSAAVTYDRQFAHSYNPYVYYKGKEKAIVDFSKLVKVRDGLYIQFLAAGEIPNEMLPKFTTSMKVEVHPVKIDDIFKVTDDIVDEARVKKGDVVLLVQADAIRIQALDDKPATDPNYKMPEWTAVRSQDGLVKEASQARVVNVVDLMLAEKFPDGASEQMSVKNTYTGYTVAYGRKPEDIDYSLFTNEFRGTVYGASQEMRYKTQLGEYPEVMIRISCRVPRGWPNDIKKGTFGQFLISPKSTFNIHKSNNNPGGEVRRNMKAMIEIVSLAKEGELPK